MGSKFIEKHKRKSLLAALLLLFRGKARYVVLLVMVLGASAPFVVSQDMLHRLVTFAPVSYVLRAVGLHSVITALDSSYSNDILRAAIDRAMHDSDQDSVWNSFLRGMSGTMTGAGAGAGSSLAMLRGGGDYYRAGEPGKAGKRKPGEVAGAVSDEDKARGAGADAVDFEDYLSGVAGAGGPGDGSGFGYMGGGGAGSYGGALGSGSPFMNRTMLGKGRGAGGASDGMYGGAMNQAASRVPVAGNPKPVSGQRMGRASGFSWRNAGYRQGGGDPGSRINKQGAMFRLAETFTMTGAAYKNPTASSEYQASHVGATYDGNEVGLQEIQTDTTPPPVPDNSWTSDLMQGADGLMEQAQHCSKVAGEQSTHISENADKMDEIAQGMGKPPKCCKGSAVDRWNGKIESIKALCKDNNARNSVISAACQSEDKPVNCNNHDKGKIKKCSKLKCWIGIILAILLIIVGAFLLGPIGIALIVAGAMMLIGQIVGGPFGAILSALGAIAAMFIGGPLIGLAAGFAGWVVSQAGPEDGSNALNND